MRISLGDSGLMQWGVDSRYGTGLIPESAPLVEDIADFWCQYHLGKPLREWHGGLEAS